MPYYVEPFSGSYEGFVNDLTLKNPTLWALASRQGTLGVLYSAAQNGWSPETQESWLIQTPYYQSTSEAARQWDTLWAFDPAEAQKRQAQAALVGRQAADRLGYTFPSQMDQFLFEGSIAREGMSEEEIYKNILWRIALDQSQGNYSYARGMPAEFGNVMTGFYKTARDYGVGFDVTVAADWAAKILLGSATEEGMTQQIRNWAKGIYAGNQPLIEAIDEGYTVADYAQPYMQMAMQELELNPAEIDLADSKWMAAFHSRNVDGTMSPMSMQDWQRTIRNEAQYGFDSTANARQTSSQLTQTLAQQFGAMG